MSNNLEIERKFLVKREFLPCLEGRDFGRFRQFYLTEGYNPTIRIRIIDTKQAYITIKGAIQGLTCPEFEYEIPFKDAQEMEESLPHTAVVHKQRYIIENDKSNWEVDVFQGCNDGLVMAEIELQSEDERVALPNWCGEEVTHDNRFKNINLALNPVSNWSNSERNSLSV